jgi:hypothetical protein
MGKQDGEVSDIAGKGFKEATLPFQESMEFPTRKFRLWSNYRSENLNGHT